MHSPMHSFGESNTHPSTPCSASTECGGRRSTRPGSAADFVRGVFFKSAAALPVSVVVELIMRVAKRQFVGENDSNLLENALSLSRAHSPSVSPILAVYSQVSHSSYGTDPLPLTHLPSPIHSGRVVEPLVLNCSPCIRA